MSAAEGQREQASLTYNPRLILQSENTRFWGTPAFRYATDADSFAYLSQVIERGEKRQRRLELASSVVRLTEIETSVLARQIAGRVSLAYWTAVGASVLSDLVEQDAQAYEGIVQYHRDRVKEGAMAEVDLLRVQLERDRLTVNVRNAEQDYRLALIALRREMGRSDYSALTLTDKLSDVREVPSPDMEEIYAVRPELRALRENIERANANLRLQQAMARPDPEALFGYKRTAGYDTLIGGFQISLPFRNRNQGQIAAASAEINAAKHELRAMQTQIKAELESAWETYQARRRLLTETLGPMRDRASEIARIALAAYREGGIDLLRLIDAQRARLEALTTYYRALSEYQQSVTNLQIVTGAPL